MTELSDRISRLEAQREDDRRAIDHLAAAANVAAQRPVSNGSTVRFWTSGNGKLAIFCLTVVSILVLGSLGYANIDYLKALISLAPKVQP